MDMPEASEKLPFEPEILLTMQGRYAEAIREVNDVESVTMGLRLSTGEQRRHVFDFADGVRLVVSRDALAGHPVHIHLGGSAIRGSLVWENLAAGLLSPDDFAARCLERFRFISCNDGQRLDHFFPCENRPHWFGLWEGRRPAATFRAEG